MHYSDVAGLIGQATTVIGASSFLTLACPIVTQSIPVIGLTLLIPSGAIACGIVAVGSASIAAWGNPDYKIHFSLGTAAIVTGISIAIAGVTGVIVAIGLSVFAGAEYQRRNKIYQEKLAQLKGNLANNQLVGK